MPAVASRDTRTSSRYPSAALSVDTAGQVSRDRNGSTPEATGYRGRLCFRRSPASPLPSDRESLDRRSSPNDAVRAPRCPSPVRKAS